MKIGRVGDPGSEKPVVIDEAGQVRDISAVTSDITPTTLVDVIEALKIADISSFPVIGESLRYGPPVANIGKVIGIGLNYRKHAEEAGMALPQEPIYFLKATSSICGPDDDVILPRDAQKGDWEIELGVVIGKKASYVSEDEAMTHVAGYCIVNDVSERGYQLERGTQWTKGKSCDTFCPIGPWLVTADEVDDPHDLNLRLSLNGEVMQDGCSDDLVFRIPRLISTLSEYFTLQPGDVIATGTPSGVGFGLKPQRYLKPGDQMLLEINGLGTQRQTVKGWPC